MGLTISLMALCFTLAGVETLHGILRNTVIAPRIGTRRAKRLSVISGTLLAFAVCYLWIPTLGLHSSPALLGVGILLASFMALFDIVLARYLIHQRWRVILKDFDPRQGNFLLFGLLGLAVIPLLVITLQK